jgi:uncharacterized protein YecE (DUF72 family)
MIRVGTSGYNYREWRGRFYPKTLRAADMLRFYAARFDTVEINATFYRTPTPAVVASWAAAVPDAFVFSLKAPRRITHVRRLLDLDEPLRLFCDAAAALGPKRGPLLFQLPPNLHKDTGRLAALLQRVPRDVRCAVEFRHDSWRSGDVYDVLRRRDAALCIADTESGTTPDVATASWGYLRLRDAGYAERDLEGWASRLRGAGWADVFVYFKHGLRAPRFAARLRRALETGPAPPRR